MTAGRAEKLLWFWVLLRFLCPFLPLPPPNTEEWNPCNVQQHPLPGRWDHHPWPQHQNQLCMLLPPGHESQFEDLLAANGQVCPERVPSAPADSTPWLFKHQVLSCLSTASHKELGWGYWEAVFSMEYSPTGNSGAQIQIQALSHTNKMALEIDSPTLGIGLMWNGFSSTFLEAQQCFAYVNQILGPLAYQRGRVVGPDGRRESSWSRSAVYMIYKSYAVFGPQFPSFLCKKEELIKEGFVNYASWSAFGDACKVNQKSSTHMGCHMMF